MPSPWDSIPYEAATPYLVGGRGGFRVGRSHVGVGHVGSRRAVMEHRSVADTVPIETADTGTGTGNTIGAVRLAGYTVDLDGFDYPDIEAGDGVLELFFADFEASAPGENVMTVTVDGVEVLTGLDPYDLAGADTEHVAVIFMRHPIRAPLKVRLIPEEGHTFINDATYRSRTGRPTP